LSAYNRRKTIAVLAFIFIYPCLIDLAWLGLWRFYTGELPKFDLAPFVILILLIVPPLLLIKRQQLAVNFWVLAIGYVLGEIYLLVHFNLLFVYRSVYPWIDSLR
jgi:hypothetical protein